MKHEWKASQDDEGKRLDQWIEEKLGNVSRSQITKWIKEGRCEVIDGKVKAAWRLRGRETVILDQPEQVEPRLEAQEMSLEIIYEDSDIILVNKPAGCIVHPAPGRQDGSLLAGVMFYAGQAKEKWQPFMVHRLDEDTSGIICFAKNQQSQDFLQCTFRERQVLKRYLTLLLGRPRSDHFSCDGAIGHHSKHIYMRTVRNDGKGNPKEAFTSFVVRERHENYVVVEARPKTGRTHQIRVHAQELGWPVAADKIYSRKDNFSCPVPGMPQEPHCRLNRQALHAWAIKIPHPQGGHVSACVHPPEDMMRAIADRALLPMEWSRYGAECIQEDLIIADDESGDV